MKFLSSLIILLCISIGFSQEIPVHQIIYEGSDEIFPNPERGFSTHRSSKITLDFVQDMRDQSVTVIQRIYMISSFRHSHLSQDYLDLIEDDFNTAREGGAKLVLRFSYTNIKTGEDAPLDTILAHISQLGPLFQEHYDIIAYIEAGFIGAWGEWYYSYYGLNNTNARRSVLFKELSVLPSDRAVVVRTPSYKRNIFGMSEPLSPDSAFSGSYRARTGAHNDCFLASATDYGTYVANDIEGDKNYLNLDNRYVPQGGETCKDDPTYTVCSNALIDLARMHWSVLNKDYHPDVLNRWESEGCMDEIKQRLGYRFGLIEAVLPDSIKPGGIFSLSFDIQNQGFASPYNPRNLEIILRNNDNNNRYFLISEEDPRFWMAGDTAHIDITAGIPVDIPQGSYEVLLHLADPAPALHGRPEYAIRLANMDVWEDTTGYNSLLHIMEIHASAPGDLYDGDDYFMPLEDHPTGLTPDNHKQPQSFRLKGNFPNPFNASTVIMFDLKNASYISLDIHDVNGKLIEHIADEKYPSGTHRILWNPQNISSGIYFYRLRVDGISQVRQALYIK